MSPFVCLQELHASWDQPTETVVLHKVEPTHLQALALQYAEKVFTFHHSFHFRDVKLIFFSSCFKAAQLVDSNERFLEAKTGGNKEEWGNRGGVMGVGGASGAGGGKAGGWNSNNGKGGGKGKGGKGKGAGKGKGWGDRGGKGTGSSRGWGDGRSGKGAAAGNSRWADGSDRRF
jgi:translation initiation factor 3 subunit C